MATYFLTLRERQEYDALPSQTSHREVVQYFTLTPDDLAEVRACRGDPLRLGFALQLGLLRWLGRFPETAPQAPTPVIRFVAEQLDLAPKLLKAYSDSDRTRRDQQERIRQYLRYRRFEDARTKVIRWLLPLAIEHDFAHGLLDALIDYLRREKVVRPGISTLEFLVTQARDHAEKKIGRLVEQQLNAQRRRALNELLLISEGELVSRLQWLKEPPLQATAKRLLEWLKKIETCRALGADNLDLCEIHPNRIKLLARRARQRSNWEIKRTDEARQHTLLACFLYEALPDITDEAVEMQMQLLGRIFRRAERKRDAQFAAEGQAINNKVILFNKIGRILLDEKGVPNVKVRPQVYERVIPREQLAEAVDESDTLVRPTDFNALSYTVRSYPYFRRFSPEFLDVMRFHSDQKPDPLLEAIRFARRANAEARSDWDDAPTEFIPQSWKKQIILQAGKINRQLYELCLLDCLVKALQSGRLWLEHSHQYTSFRRDWISDADWPAAREAFLADHPELEDCQRYLARRRQALDERMAAVNEHWQSLQHNFKLVDDRLHLTRLEAVPLPEGTKELREKFLKLFPLRTLPELLLEVNSWTNFTDQLTSLNPQVRAIPNLTARKLAVIIAHGTNLGLYAMAKAVDTMRYDDLAWVSDWYVREDTLRQACVELVNFLCRQPISSCWGDGTTSSSDGQLFSVQASALYARTNPHSPEFGPSMKSYTHLADNLAPFYSQWIESTANEAPQIVDGLLHHETDLQPTEHYSDANGYMDTVFGLCHLLGFRFAPRMRDLSERRLYRMRRNLGEFPNIKELFTARINNGAIYEGWDDMLRLVVSVKRGLVPAARALTKLNKHHPEQKLFHALQEVGRIDKTIFLLDLARSRDTRRRVLVGLNKQEAYHSLTRALWFGRSGALAERELEAQANQITCLRLLATAIIVWNAVYLGAAVEKLRTAGEEVQDYQLAHIYPLFLDSVNLIGKYHFPGEEVFRTRPDALPLRTPEQAASPKKK